MALRPRMAVFPPSRIGPLRQTFTGRIVVRLRRHLVDGIEGRFPERKALTLGEVSSSFDRSGLERLLRDLDDPPTARLIHRWTIDQTRRREAGGRENDDPSFRSLNSYFSVDFPGRTLAELTAIALRFRAERDDVDSAFVEPAVEPASPVTPDEHTHPGLFHDGQGYVFGDHMEDSVQSGINAEAVWGAYDGSGVKLVVLEEGWKVEHPDLPHPGGYPLQLLDSVMVNVEAERDHGTMTLGVIAAVDHAGAGAGIVGIAPSVTIPGLASYVYSSSSKWEIVDAIAAAIDALGAGDILLIEVHTTSTVIIDGVPLPSGYPIEIVDHWLDAIRLAVMQGITVVEPAGNPSPSSSSFDLDNAKWPPSGPGSRSLDPADPTFIDSGAILVGACQPVPVADDLHDRMNHAWFGKRIDCYAWGDSVLSTRCYGIDYNDGQTKETCDDGVPAEPTYGRYSGTSSASAIIAGVAAIVQQMHQAALSTAASPGRIRELLRDPANGTPIGNIGSTVRSMPDLAKIGGSLSALPDVYVRDSLSDVGAVPSPVVSMSPDVFVLSAPLDPVNPGPPANDWTKQVPNHEVVPNADNYVYVRISNLSAAAAAHGCDAMVFWSPPASLILPSDWRLIGGLPATVTVPAAGHVLAGPVIWHPSPADLPYGGHGCFIVQLDHPDDPRPIVAPGTITWNEFLAFVGRSNNVAWRNFNVIPVPPVPPAPPSPAGAWEGAGFEMRGAPGRPAEFDFAILPIGFPRGTRLFWRMPAREFRAFEELRAIRSLKRFEAGDDRIVVESNEGSSLRLHGARLEADARIPMSFGVFLPDSGLEEPARLELRQFHRRMEVGRITWQFTPAPTGAAGSPA